MNTLTTVVCVMALALANCGHAVGSYFEGRKILHYEDLRIANPEMVQDCVFLKQIRGEAKFRSSAARDEALDRAAQMGADTVTIVMADSDAGIRQYCVIDAYYCAGKPKV